MKSNKFTFASIGFVSGIVLTVSIMAIYGFSPSPSAPAGGFTTVSAAVANGYFKNYMTGAVSFNQVLKGVNVDKNQLDAMNSIIKENPALTRFRIYFGKDPSAKLVSIVVGVDSKGLDAVTNSIYSTNAPGSPCPTVCDNSSPVTKD